MKSIREILTDKFNFFNFKESEDTINNTLKLSNNSNELYSSNIFNTNSYSQCYSSLNCCDDYFNSTTTFTKNNNKVRYDIKQIVLEEQELDVNNFKFLAHVKSNEFIEINFKELNNSTYISNKSIKLEENLENNNKNYFENCLIKYKLKSLNSYFKITANILKKDFVKRVEYIYSLFKISNKLNSTYEDYFKLLKDALSNYPNNFEETNIMQGNNDSIIVEFYINISDNNLKFKKIDSFTNENKDDFKNGFLFYLNTFPKFECKLLSYVSNKIRNIDATNNTLFSSNANLESLFIFRNLINEEENLIYTSCYLYFNISQSNNCNISHFTNFLKDLKIQEFSKYSKHNYNSIIINIELNCLFNKYNKQIEINSLLSMFFDLLDKNIESSLLLRFKIKLSFLLLNSVSQGIINLVNLKLYLIYTIYKLNNNNNNVDNLNIFNFLNNNNTLRYIINEIEISLKDKLFNINDEQINNTYNETVSIKNFKNIRSYIKAINDIINFNKDKVLNFVDYVGEIYKVYSESCILDNNKANNMYIDSLKISVSPCNIKFLPIYEDAPNRLIKKYLPSEYHGLKCNFRTSNYTRDNKKKRKYNYLNIKLDLLLISFYKKYFLNEGLVIYNQRYKFFFYSQSQFRSDSCFLTSIQDRYTLLKQIGNFQNVNSLPKLAARVGQTLTSTYSTIKIKEESYYVIDDRVYNNKIFTDGVGRISFSLAFKITKALNINNINSIIQNSNKFNYNNIKHYVPSAFQARFLGCKGVWTVIHPDNAESLVYFDNVNNKSIYKSTQDRITKEIINKYKNNEDVIECRYSQLKFDISNFDENGESFELCNYSKYLKCYLNRQIIILLCTLSLNNNSSYYVNNYIYNNLYSNYVNSLSHDRYCLTLLNYSSWYKIIKHMIEFGAFNSTNNYFINNLSKNVKEVLFKNIKNKHHIAINNGVYVMAVSDEFGLLEENECFLRIVSEEDVNNNNNQISYFSKNNINTSQHSDYLDIILNKKCIVTKCPCIHPGDIRIMDFKRYNINNHDNTFKYKIYESYKNVLIFSHKGNRPDPDKISNSDLDGDCYFVIFDDYLCNKINSVEPAESVTNNSKFNDINSILNLINSKQLIEEVVNYFCDFSVKNNLGLIADIHLSISDSDTLVLSNNPKALELADKYYTALDAPKTGIFAEIDSEDKAVKRPHYLSKFKNFNNKRYYLSESTLGLIYNDIVNKLETSNLLKDNNSLVENNSYNYKIKENNIISYISQLNSEFLNKNIIYVYEAIYLIYIYSKDFETLMTNYNYENEYEFISGTVTENLSELENNNHSFDIKEKIRIKFDILINKFNKYCLNPFSCFFRNNFKNYDSKEIENIVLNYNNLSSLNYVRRIKVMIYVYANFNENFWTINNIELYSNKLIECFENAYIDLKENYINSLLYFNSKCNFNNNVIDYKLDNIKKYYDDKLNFFNLIIDNSCKEMIKELKSNVILTKYSSCIHVICGYIINYLNYQYVKELYK